MDVEGLAHAARARAAAAANHLLADAAHWRAHPESGEPDVDVHVSQSLGALPSRRQAKGASVRLQARAARMLQEYATKYYVQAHTIV